MSTTPNSPLIGRAPIEADARPAAIVYCEANFGELDGKIERLEKAIEIAG